MPGAAMEPGREKMRLCRNFVLGILVVLSKPGFAAQTPENILKAIVKIKTIIPKDAATAQILGTEREGNGVIRLFNSG